MELEFSLEDIGEAAQQIVRFAGDRKVWVFDGEMGAGKTTLIYAICGYLNIDGNFGSPTFSIINEYVLSGKPVYHIDLYRCKDEEEAARAGVEDCLYSGQLCFVEWPSRAAGLLPENILQLRLTVVSRNVRRVEVRAFLPGTEEQQGLNRL